MHPHRTKMFDFNFNRIFYTNKFLQLVVFISICCSATAQTSPETNFTNIMNKAKQDLLKMIQKGMQKYTVSIYLQFFLIKKFKLKKSPRLHIA